MKRKILMLLCIFSLLLAFNAVAHADGVTEIWTRSDLEAIANNTGGNYVLKADIDLSGSPWTPIPWFGGTLDGAGHTITGMTIMTLDNSVSNIGLFGTLDGATISNLHLSDVLIDVMTSGFVSVGLIGTPVNISNFDVYSDTCSIINCHANGSVSVDASASNYWISVFALACAEDSTADVDVDVSAQNYNAGLLWNCINCSVHGDIRLSAQNGALARIMDCIDCNSFGDIIVEPSSSGQGSLHAAGIIGLNNVSSGCEGEGKVEHTGRTSFLSNCEYCSYSGSLVSDNGFIITNCYECEVDCQASNYGNSDLVSFRIIDDYSEDRGGNIANGKLARTSAVKDSFEIKSYLGRDSEDHVNIELYEGKGTGSVYLEAGGVYGMENVYPYRTGTIRADTVSGNITIWCSMVNMGNISCSTESGSINLIGGVYNTGDINIVSGGPAEIIGATYYNSGEINVTSTGGVCSVRGIDCNIYDKMEGAVNKGNINLTTSSKQNSEAIGVLAGVNAYNLGNITVTGSKTNGKAAAMGVADSLNSYNYANIKSELSTGNAYAVGVDGSGCVNCGNIRAVGNWKEGIGACGYQTEDGINYSTGSVYAENNYSGLSLDTWGAYALANNTSGSATAISRHVAVANGGTTYASSSDYRLSASNGQIGWYLAHHNASCDCGTGKGTVTDGSNPSDSWHTWLPRCDASLMEAADIPDVPDIPEVELPVKQGSGNISAKIDLYSLRSDRKIEQFQNTFGSFSWDDEDGSDDYSALEMFLQLYNQGDETKDVRFTIRLPDGFSFSPTSPVRTLDHPIECTVTPDTPYLLNGIPIYPLYSRKTNEVASFRLIGDVNETADYPVSTPDDVLISMRPTSKVNRYDQVEFPIFLKALSDSEKIPAYDAEQYFVTNPTDHYHNELAVLGCLLSQAVYNKSGMEKEDDTYITRAFHNLGFHDVVFEQNLSAYDVAAGFARKKVVSAGELYNVVMVVIRGTVDLEWVGNFDVLGEDETVHSNFAQSAQSVYQRYMSYASTHGIPRDDHTKVFICGHSRAGAVADLVAETFNITYGKQNVFAYTFAAPNSIKNPVAYNNIYNYVYKYDFVGFVPQGYGKHGVTFVVGGKNENDAPEAVKDAFARYTHGNSFEGIGCQFVIELIVYENERLNMKVDSFQRMIGLLISDPDTVADNFIAKAHGAENYCAWVIQQGAKPTIPYDSYIEDIRNDIDSLVKLVGDQLEFALKHPILNSYIHPVITGIAAGYLIKKIPHLEHEKGVRMMSISCPVDVLATDAAGAVTSTVTAHAGDALENGFLSFGDGSNTFLFISEGQEYDLTITGTDNGSMSVLSLYTQDGKGVDSAYLLEEIPVAKGEVFTVHVISSALEGLVITSSSGTVYQTGSASVPIEEAYFPDPVFREYISETWDTNSDGTLDNEEIGRVEHIMLSIYKNWISEGYVEQEEADYIVSHWQNRINSLEGLQYFTHLRWLDAFDMPLMSGTLNFSCMPDMESINVWNSGLTGIILGELPKLESIHCESNAIGSLDVSACPRLRDIHAMNAGLKTLDVSHNPLLEELWCYGNELDTLMLENNPLIVRLGCDRNRLTALDVKHMTHLRRLSLSDNKLTRLDLSGLIELEFLDCTNNALTALDVTGCTQLEELYCPRNIGLTKLNLSTLTALETLNCNRCALKTLNLKNCGSLTSLTCVFNSLTRLQLGSKPRMEKLYVNANPMEAVDVSGCPVLLELIENGEYEESQYSKRYTKQLSEDRVCVFEYDKGQLLQTSANQKFSILYLPSSLLEIGEEAFAGILADKVVLPDSCSYVAACAFANCPKLQIVSVASVTVIDPAAFQDSEHVYVLRR